MNSTNKTPPTHIYWVFSNQTLRKVNERTEAVSVWLSNNKQWTESFQDYQWVKESSKQISLEEAKQQFPQAFETK